MTRTDLTGARWSSATRCIAKAEFQALGIEGDENAQTFLQDAFVRGVHAADVWLAAQETLTRSQGKTLIPEAPIPWGPEMIWTGHADALLMEDKIVVEAYHAVGAAMRHEKALQAAGYALRQGDGWRAMLAVLDTTDVDEEEGFAVTMYPVEVDELAPEVADIERRVTAAYEAGVVNFDDRVADDPMHRECSGCPFRDPCWAGWQRPDPVEIPEAAQDFIALASLDIVRGHQKAALDETVVSIYELRDRLRKYAPPGIPISSGGIEIKRTLIAPRKSFKLSAFLAAGHRPTYEMEPFCSESEKPGERWKIIDGVS